MFFPSSDIFFSYTKQWKPCFLCWTDLKQKTIFPFTDIFLCTWQINSNIYVFPRCLPIVFPRCFNPRCQVSPAQSCQYIMCPLFFFVVHNVSLMFDDFCMFFDMVLIMSHGFQWFFDCCYTCCIIFIDVSVVHIRMFVFYNFHLFFYCCRVFYMCFIIFHSLFNGPGIFLNICSIILHSFFNGNGSEKFFVIL